MGDVIEVQFGETAALEHAILRYEGAARELFGLAEGEYWEDSVTEAMRDQYYRRMDGTWSEGQRQPQPVRRRARMRNELAEHP